MGLCLGGHGRIGGRLVVRGGGGGLMAWRGTERGGEFAGTSESSGSAIGVFESANGAAVNDSSATAGSGAESDRSSGRNFDSRDRRVANLLVERRDILSDEAAQTPEMAIDLGRQILVNLIGLGCGSGVGTLHHSQQGG